jgi:hypothetical protein
MAKKEFKTGLDVIFEPSQKRDDVTINNSSEEKPIVSIEKEVRATFIIREKQLVAIKAIAYWERKQIKHILNEVIDVFIASYNNNDLINAQNEYKRVKNEE